MTSNLITLTHAARTAMERAYAPYSHFRVGAALLAEDGRIFTGCNIENASYGQTICAERAAVVAGVSEGAKRFVRLVVAVDAPKGAAPCGLCRQTLAEFSGDDLEVILVGAASERRFTLGELLPRAFRPSDVLG